MSHTKKVRKRCFKCGNSQNFVKNGLTRDKKQRYQCPVCKSNITIHNRSFVKNEIEELFNQYLNSDTATVIDFCNSVVTKDLNSKTLSKNFKAHTPLYRQLKKVSSSLTSYLQRKLDISITKLLHIALVDQSLILRIEPELLNERFFEDTYTFSEFKLYADGLRYTIAGDFEGQSESFVGWEYINPKLLENRVVSFRAEFRKERQRQKSR